MDAESSAAVVLSYASKAPGRFVELASLGPRYLRGPAEVENGMKPSTLKQTLASGGTVFGTMLAAMSSTRFGGVLANSALDYVVIDCEHAPRDREETRQLCEMLRVAGITSIVRVPSPRPDEVAMALDAGAIGILIPYCETVEEVEAVVSAARWHPLKGEFLRRAVREGEYPSAASREYLENRHRDTVTIVGIESKPGYDNLEAILDIEGIDGIFVGPNDMSTSLGIPDDYANPIYLDVIRELILKCEAYGVAVMVHHQDRATSAKMVELGARFVLHTTDAGILQRALRSEMNELRRVAGVRVESAE